MDERKTIPLEDLDFGADSAPVGAPTGDVFGGQKRRGRKPKGAGPSVVDRATIDEIFQLASASMKLSNTTRELALSEEERKEMVDAYYRVAKEYPAFGKYITKGRTASVWGNLILVNAIVLGKRLDIIAEKIRLAQEQSAAEARKRGHGARPTAVAQTGPARPAMRQERIGEDDLSGEAVSG